MDIKLIIGCHCVTMWCLVSPISSKILVSGAVVTGGGSRTFVIPPPYSNRARRAAPHRAAPRRTAPPARPRLSSFYTAEEDYASRVDVATVRCVKNKLSQKHIRFWTP